MHILHPFSGPVQDYGDCPREPDRHRPTQCPQCDRKQSLTGHGFYRRTIADRAFNGVINIRRYLCRACRRTVSLLPEFALPYLRFSIPVIAAFLTSQSAGHTLAASLPPGAPYQRGQHWMRRFRAQAESLCASLAALTAPVPAGSFVQRAIAMLALTGWIPAHRFLFAFLRQHLLGWPPSLAPAGRRVTLAPTQPPPRPRTQTICLEPRGPPSHTGPGANSLICLTNTNPLPCSAMP